jgi:hypothetical protein
MTIAKLLFTYFVSVVLRVYVRVGANDLPLPMSVIYCCVEVTLFVHFTVGQGLLIVKNTRSHSDTPQSVGLLYTSDKAADATI